MISSDILVLAMAAIAGSMAIILTIFAVRMYRNEQDREGPAAGQDEQESDADAEMESPGAERLPPPKTPSAPSTETPTGPEWEPQPVAEPMSNTVATILRNPETGQVILQVGGRPFISAQALKESSSWPEVQTALSDLMGWLSETGGAETYFEDLSDEEEDAEPVSMIDEINEILSDMAKEARGKLRGVRLAEGTGGLVRVFVGIESYDLEEVPDPDVRRLIREAVQEWESRR